MLTFEKCKRKLNNNTNKYNDEEIVIIKNILNKIAEIEIRYIEKKDKL